MSKCIIEIDTDTVLLISELVQTLTVYNTTIIDDSNTDGKYTIKHEGKKQMVALDELNEMLAHITSRPYFVVPDKEEQYDN